MACLSSKVTLACRPTWRSQIEADQHVQQYLSRLTDLAQNQPHLLVAHSYALHAGLLAGGQITKKMLRKHVVLEEGKGVAAYSYKVGTAKV